MRGNRGFGLIHLFIFLCVFIFFLFTVSFLVHKTGLDKTNNTLLHTQQELDADINTNNAGVNSNRSSSSYSSNRTTSTNDFDYTSIEKQLKTAASLYQKDLYPDFNSKDDVMYVTSKKLIALDYLTNLTDGRVSCEGYARFTYDNIVKTEPYIKCGSNYKTKGYEARYAK